MEGRLLVNDQYLLEKYPGKGGWTYIILPATIRDKQRPKGGILVNGFIDNFELKDYTLMPIKNGDLFLPVKAGIRKSIGKSAGDHVKLVLYTYHIPEGLPVPYEFLVCLKDNPEAYTIFLSYTEAEQQAFIDWIAAAKNQDSVIERITKAIDLLAHKQKLGK